MTRLHSPSGLSDAEWFRRSIEEARNDPVGLWQMVNVGRRGFGLDGDALEEFVKTFIVEMIQSGAQPILGDRKAVSGWRPFLQYGSDPQSIAVALIHEWKNSHEDPNVDGVWFAFPSVWR